MNTTWSQLRDALERKLAAFAPDRIMLDRYTDPDETIYSGETAWIACYPVPATNEGFHVYIDHTPQAAMGSRRSCLTITGKSWNSAQAVAAACVAAQLVLEIEGSL